MANDDQMKVIDICQLLNWGFPANFIVDNDDNIASHEVISRKDKHYG